MKTIIVCGIFIVLLLALMYNLDLFGFRSRIRGPLKPPDRKFKSSVEHDELVIRDAGRTVFSFSLSLLKSCALIKRESYPLDIVFISFQNKDGRDFTVSEDEIDTVVLFEQMKILLKMEDIFIKTMMILQEDTVVLWDTESDVATS